MVLSIKLMLRYIIFPKANLSTCILVHAIKLFSNSNHGILNLGYTEVHNWGIHKGLQKISMFYEITKIYYIFQILSPLI